MDFSWLGGIFQAVVNLLKPLLNIKHWQIWAAIWDIYTRLRNWYRWYQQNVQKQIQAARARFNKIYDQFVLPILKIVDTIRRITGAIGIVNTKLATKLNAMFLRVESFILRPLNDVNAKLNQMAQIFTGFLTPLGYLERATLINSLWKNLADLRGLTSWGGTNTLAGTPVPAGVAVSTMVSTASADEKGQQTPITDAVQAAILNARSYLGE